ncbi:MAG: TonB-dependent receptor plug domain-containing protein [Bacteroidetes bacterium]|nr:TonB-dependent receptor plug domain-containing protein [Bacteroidota bacterium]
MLNPRYSTRLPVSYQPQDADVPCEEHLPLQWPGAPLSVLLAVVLLGSLVLFRPNTAGAQASGRLSGVIQAEAGDPLPGATVRLEGTSYATVAGQDGRFRLSPVPEGTYTAVAQFVGFEPAQQAVRIEAGAAAEVTFTLAERTLALDGVVVSAQKRLQAVEEVPAALSVLDGQLMQNLEVEQFDDLSAFVPGLEVQLQSPNNPGFVVRGITSDSGDSRIEPRVSVFQDGVSISKSRGSVVELFDMERVEVLKGPQGTLFGRGAQIGAVHLIQNKPERRVAAEATVGVGNFSERYATGVVNTPLTDNLLLRVAGIYSQHDGVIENELGGRLNGKETQAGRLSLRWLPTDRTVVDAIVNVQRDTPPGIAFKSGTFAPPSGALSPFASAAMGGADPVLGDDDLFVDRTVWGITLLADHQLAPAWMLSSITAYREFDSLERFDADGTPAPALQFDEDAFGQQVSQELRLNYDGGERFRGFGGASLFWEDGYQRVPFRTDERSFFALLSPLLNQANPALPALPLLNPDGSPNLSFTTNPLTGQPLKESHQEVSTNLGSMTALEVFADGTYDVTPRWSLTAGLRATYEEGTGGLDVPPANDPGTLGFALGAGPNNLFTPTEGRQRHSESFTSVVGRLATNYRLGTAATVFGSVARGRRPNVIEVSAPSTVNVLNNEIVWSYDVGVKGLLWQDRLQYDAAAFYYDYFNFQTSVVELTADGLVSETRDSGNATALGGEASLRAALADGLSVFGSYGYTNATFDDTDTTGEEQELAGNRFRLTPEHTLALGGELSAHPGALGRLWLRPTFTFKSQVFFEEDNEPGIAQDGYGLVNLRAGIDLPGGRVTVSGFVQNVTDTEYLIDAGNTGGAFGIPTFIPGPPRTFGVRLTGRL